MVSRESGSHPRDRDDGDAHGHAVQRGQGAAEQAQPDHRVEPLHPLGSIGRIKADSRPGIDSNENLLCI